MCAINAAPIGVVTEEALCEQRRFWKEVALCVDRADRKRAEEAVRKIYYATHLPPPRILWFESPVSGAIAAQFLSRISPSVHESVHMHTIEHAGKRLWEQIQGRGSKDWWLETFLRLDQHPQSLRISQLSNRVLDLVIRHVSQPWQFREDELSMDSIQMLSNVYETVYAALEQTVNAAEWHGNNPLEEPIDHRTRSLAVNGVRLCGGGSFDAHSLQFLDFGRRCGLRLPAVEGIVQLAQSCGMWWPLQDYCVLTERPKLISIDRQGRFHSSKSKAIQYRDGWGVFAWHGTVVPQRLIRVVSQRNIADLITEPNIELKRLMIEAYGYERFLHDSKARIIHRDKCGVLYHREIANDEPLVMVQVINSTPEPDGTYRRYFLRVPPTIRTARAAVAWTFGLKPEIYEPDMES